MGTCLSGVIARWIKPLLIVALSTFRCFQMTPREVRSGVPAACAVPTAELPLGQLNAAWSHPVTQKVEQGLPRHILGLLAEQVLDAQSMDRHSCLHHHCCDFLAIVKPEQSFFITD